jgi:agmatinase
VSPSPPDQALFHIIPVPLEKSVSYGGGTAAGPAAILEASSQLERFTGRNDPSSYGLCTFPDLDCNGEWEDIRPLLAARVGETLEMKKIPVILGGEHTLSWAVVDAVEAIHTKVGVVQFDAHTDLRQSYLGSASSHACVMRRIHETGISICQLGTRSYSREEHDYRLEQEIFFRDSEDLWRNGLEPALPEDFPERVYITFDIDCLDPGLMPASGTPVPGGLNWYQAMWLLEKILATRVCVGFDVVEFAPVPGFHGPSFTAAQLVYNIMGYLAGSGINQRFHQF